MSEEELEPADSDDSGDASPNQGEEETEKPTKPPAADKKGTCS